MRKRTPRHIIAASALASFVASTVVAQPRPDWPDGFLSRVEILALIQTLNASLLASKSATATLENWCAAHRMADAPKVIALRVAGADKPASEETRQRLRVEPGEPLKYRHVQLSCGGHVLSEADNWYAPGRLTADMNRALETTDAPFGKVVQPLQPFRRTIEMRMRWSPLPDGWELAAPDSEAGKGRGALDIPHEIFEHRAILYTADQKPFSEVHETYMNELLDFRTKPRSGEP